MNKWVLVKYSNIDTYSWGNLTNNLCNGLPLLSRSNIASLNLWNKKILWIAWKQQLIQWLGNDLRVLNFTLWDNCFTKQLSHYISSSLLQILVHCYRTCHCKCHILAGLNRTGGDELPTTLVPKWVPVVDSYSGHHQWFIYEPAMIVGTDITVRISQA